MFKHCWTAYATSLVPSVRKGCRVSKQIRTAITAPTMEKRMGVLIHMCANVLFLTRTGASKNVHPNGRKQQSTEHERLRRDGSSIQLMCTSTGRHEGFWKRMGVLISPMGQKFFSSRTEQASNNVHPIHGSSDPHRQERMKAHLETHEIHEGPLVENRCEYSKLECTSPF